MENTNPQIPPVQETTGSSFFERLANSVVLKFVIMFILVLFLLIPMEWVHGLIGERREREQTVASEIAGKWGQPQVISGPVIGIPYTYMSSVNTTDDRGKPKVETYIEKDYVFLAAKKTEFSSEITPEYLKRGIYQTVVYNATLKLHGHFEELDLAKLGIPADDLQWEHAKVFIGLSDLKGLTTTPQLKWKDENLGFQMGAGDVGLFERTMESDINLSGKSTKGQFLIQMDVRGSRSLTFFPTAEETAIQVAGGWENPSFDGGFLPEDRTVGADTFAASWRIPSFGRKFPQQWTGAKKSLYTILNTDFSDTDTELAAATVDAGTTATAAQAVEMSTEQDMVRIHFLESVNNYQKTTRAAKYGILIVLLTFTSLFFTEVIKKKRIHIVQYVLIGCAMVLFYSLLLAIGEHVGFNWSYFISALATIILIASFIYGITKQMQISWLFSLILAVFYAFIYLLMQLQDFSLIVGTVGVFVILAILMRLSTRVNWYQFDRRN